MSIVILDETGAKKDLDWLHTKYGRFEILEGQGYPCWRVVQIQETSGPAIMKVRALDEIGAPGYVLSVLTWPDPSNPSGDLPKFGGDPAKSPWSSRGVGQFTDPQSGFTGYGLGHDSYIKDFAAGGPYHVWMYDKNSYSDIVKWIGWLGGTNHQGMCSITFKKVLDPEGPPDPDDGDDENPTSSEIVTAIQDVASAIRELGEILHTDLSPLHESSSSSSAACKYALARPLPSGIGKIQSIFGVSGSDGMSYEVLEGTDVLASHDGCFTSQMFSSSNFKGVISNGVVSTEYHNLRDVKPFSGSNVKAGDVIGWTSGDPLYIKYKIIGVGNPAYGDYLDPLIGRKLNGDA